MKKPCGDLGRALFLCALGMGLVGLGCDGAPEDHPSPYAASQQEGEEKGLVDSALLGAPTKPIQITTWTLRMPLINKQEETNWCWAAACEQVGRYIRGFSPTQKEIVTHVFGSPVNQSAYASRIGDGCRFATGYTTSFSAGWTTISMSEIKYKIFYQEHPVLISLGFYDRYNNRTGGHMLVIDGVESPVTLFDWGAVNNADRVHAIDPWDGSSRWIRYTDLFIPGSNYLGGRYEQTVWY